MDKVEELAELMVELASIDELRYEALFHAWPEDPREDLADAECTESCLGSSRRR